MSMKQTQVPLNRSCGDLTQRLDQLKQQLVEQHKIFRFLQVPATCSFKVRGCLSPLGYALWFSMGFDCFLNNLTHIHELKIANNASIFPSKNCTYRIFEFYAVIGQVYTLFCAGL